MKNWIMWMTLGALALLVMIVIVAFTTGDQRFEKMTTSEYLKEGQYVGLYESPKESWYLYSPPCSWESLSSSTTESSEGGQENRSLCADVTEDVLVAKLRAGDSVTVDSGTQGVVTREVYRKRFVETDRKRSFKPSEITGPEGIALDVQFHESGVQRSVRLKVLPNEGG